MAEPILTTLPQIPLVRNYNMPGLYRIMIEDAMSPPFEHRMSPYALAVPDWTMLASPVQLWNILTYIAHNYELILFYIREIAFLGYTWEKDLAYFAVRFLLLAAGAQLGLASVSTSYFSGLARSYFLGHMTLWRMF